MTIRLFATLKDRAGRAEIEIDLPAGATVADLRTRIGEAFPHLAALAARSVVAINREFAFAQDLVHPEDEIALFPPVSGG
jgi:molybdopterin converting factor subunit 1